MELQVAGITKESLVDGPGIRLVVFVQGCPHHCPGCHNPQTHDPNGGRLMDTDDVLTMIDQSHLLRGVTFSGGEPFMQAAGLAHLGSQLHVRGFNIFTYTGFLYEHLLAMGMKNQSILDLLAQTDVLVDGPYREAERDLQLAFRGSANQRLIDVPESLRSGHVILWEDPYQVKLVSGGI